MAILVRRYERLHHFRVNVIAIEAVELAQPEVETRIIESRFRRVIRISAQVSEILHQHKCLVELLCTKSRVLGYVPQDGSDATRHNKPTAKQTIEPMMINLTR